MELLYCDDRVIVCVKPAGLLSTDEPGGVPEAIREALGDPAANIRGVHRLDRVVGGVMVYARTKRAAAELSEQIRSGLFKKSYLAVVRGIPEKDRDTLRDWLIRDRQSHRTRVVSPETPGAQEAVLSYERLETDGTLSLLSVALHTGRTHQIRCQLAHRGLPIAGDAKYGEPAEHGTALWSHRLSFCHPRTGERLTFSSAPPDADPWRRFSHL